MTTGLQRVAWFAQWRAAGKPSNWEEQFIQGPGSKVLCRECGAQGYHGWPTPHPWQVACLIGHATVCDECGAPGQNLGSHRTCRSGHTGCCQHADTQYRQLQRIKER